MSDTAKAAVLARIRAALGHPIPPSATALAASWDALPRLYNQTSHLTPDAQLDLLEDRLRDYDAEVTRIPEAAVPDAIATILAARGNLPTLIPPGFPALWTPPNAPLTPDENLLPHELDCFDGVLTAATLAIAETGTLVLQNVPGQGRRAATLVPDFHLCVVRPEDIVQTVPQAFARLARTATLPTTFVSGPSATADIEMTRIKGVHGPRSLHVLLVTESPTELTR